MARVAQVAQKALLGALTTDAFGCHFLTDLFASGYMRVPRRILGERYGTIVGGLQMCHGMHSEDNERGLWCVSRQTQHSTKRVVWRAYGDGMLRKEVAVVHLCQVQEAVDRRLKSLRPSAELISRRLSEPRRSSQCRYLQVNSPGLDTLPDGSPAPRDEAHNHWPLYWFRSANDDQIVHRDGSPDQNRYVRLLNPFGSLVISNPVGRAFSLSTQAFDE